MNIGDVINDGVIREKVENHGTEIVVVAKNKQNTTRTKYHFKWYGDKLEFKRMEINHRGTSEYLRDIKLLEERGIIK